MDTPRVAIAMRTKDRPLLLRRALDDVLAQTYEDWRLVVVNDGGAPEPLNALVAQRADRFGQRIQVLHNDSSRGMEAAANQAVAASESDYVVLHDDDDTWAPEFLAATVAHLDTFADDLAVMVRTEIVLERIDGDRVVETGREVFWADLREITLVDLLRINRAVPISILYRRSAHALAGPFREDLAAVGDWYFNLQLVQAGHVAFLPERPLAFWHQRREHAGVLGNSMYAGNAAHASSDLAVREEALQAYVRDNGIGLPLYLAKLVDSRVGELQEELGRDVRHLAELVERQNAQLAALEAAISDSSLVLLARRRYRRLKDRVADGSATSGSDQISGPAGT